MEKVKLPREVAEAIEKVMEDHGDLHSQHMTMTNWNYLHDNYHNSVKVLRPYAEANPINYMTALVIGYEVEPTPEDKAIDWLMEQDIISRKEATRIVCNIKNILEGADSN